MILVNDISVGLAQMLSKYYDFIVEDGDCWAEGSIRRRKRMKVEEKKSKIVENLVYQNGQLNCKLTQKNIKILERIKELRIVRYNTQDPVTALLIKKEIDWLKELADI